MYSRTLIMEAIGSIDDKYIERYFIIKENNAQSKTNAKQKAVKSKIKFAVAVAACLLIVCATTILILPKKFDLNYSYTGDNGEDTWIEEKVITIYYCKDGKTKSERVKLPCSLKNVFTAWKYLNNIEDDNVFLLTAKITNDGHMVEKNGVVEFIPGTHQTLTIVISKDLLKYINDENYEKIIDSIKKTYQYVPNIDMYDISIESIE